MPGIGLLHGVHRKRSNGVNGQLIQGGSFIDRRCVHRCVHCDSRRAGRVPRLFWAQGLDAPLRAEFQNCTAKVRGCLAACPYPEVRRIQRGKPFRTSSLGWHKTHKTLDSHVAILRAVFTPPPATRGSPTDTGFAHLRPTKLSYRVPPLSSAVAGVSHDDVVFCRKTNVCSQNLGDTRHFPVHVRNRCP